MKLRVTAGSVSGTATLDDSPTARALWEALPVEARASTWGEEIYFELPAPLPGEAEGDVVQRGDLAYWPPGRAFCLFFGPTPASRGGEIRAASPVRVFGRLDGDPGAFRQVRAGARVRLERLDGGGAPERPPAR